MKKLLLIALLAVVCASAQTLTSPAPPRGNTWYTPMGYAPNATTTLTASTIYLDSAHLANTTGSAVTCAFLDKTTNCNGSACQFWPTISIAANTVYEVSFGGIVVSGVTWSCSTSNAVVAQLKGALTF
jgi:hypothetical protein